MGDTTQKAAVQTGVQSGSSWVKVACAGALGIVDKDDTSVNSVIIPEVKWIEPDNMGGETDNGKGMYSVHILEIVAMDRRGWIAKGNGEGPVTFYGEKGTPVSTGGTSGGGGASGKGGAVGSGGSSGTGGATTPNQGGGGRSGSGGNTQTSSTSHASGGSSGEGGATNSSSHTGGNASAGSSGHGGSAESTGGTTTTGKTQDNGCNCSVGGQSEVPAFLFPALTGLALLLARRRRR
jgi:MYXO-CTERM domain-containing protein